MILYGASGHAKVILEIFLLNGVKVDYIFDDNPNRDEIRGIKVYKSSIRNVDIDKNAVISIGDNKIRKKIAEKYQLIYGTAIHPKSVISEFTEIGIGTVIMANATVNADVCIGKHCILNTSCVVEHDCIIEDFSHIAPNASIAGNVHIGVGTQIGIGASIIQGIKIGKWCIIGAGSVVLNDIPDFSTVVGNPGKVIKVSKDKYDNEK
jgi:sugar O-acyltransferase (sialic acid O-acetyltransferase NeuD family)